MRVKTRWHRQDKPRTPQQIASVAAFIIWRVAEASVTRLQRQEFEISSRPQGFAILAEFLAFLIQLADRVACRRLDAQQREEFTTALAARLGGILEENQPEEGSRCRFISLVNERLADYAGFDYPEEAPGFACLRCFAARVAALMNEKDRLRAMDQLMAIEAPEAAAPALKGLRDLLPLPA